MRGRPSENELHRRIADLLMSPDAGRAVAGQLRAQADEGGRRAAVAGHGAGRVNGLRNAAGTERTTASEGVPDMPLHAAKRAEHAL